MNILADLSIIQGISLANLSFLSLFLSMSFYWIGTSFKDFKFKIETKGINNNSTQQKSIFTSSLTLAQYLMLFSNILLGLLLIFRWKESGHFPLSNLYESLMFLSWCFTTINLFIEKYTFTLFSKNSSAKNRNPESTKNLVGAITTPSALLTNAFATFTLPKEMQEAAPLVPALQSNWLMMHVTVMIISYAALIIGSLLSIAFLIITFEQPFSEKRKYQKSTSSELQTVENSLNNPGITSVYFSENQTLLNSNNSTFSLTSTDLIHDSNGNKKELSNLALMLDNLSYRILGIGFPFLTIGILSGAVWANEAWGSYWSWDPKETWALLTWLIFAIYLHTRLSKGWEGKKPAIIASFGFIIVWICYLGVNLIGEGLHSYGWFSS